MDAGDVKRGILVLRSDRFLMLGVGRVQMSTSLLFWLSHYRFLVGGSIVLFFWSCGPLVYIWMICWIRAIVLLCFISTSIVNMFA